MEWLVGMLLVTIFATCALGMLRMMLRGWVRGGRRSGHWPMMCMGGDADGEPRSPEKGRLDDLRAERRRLDSLIAGAERDAGESAR